MSARELLVQLGQRRVRVWAERDRLRYAGPKGALTPDLRGTLLRQKSGLLKLLGRADGFLGMTLRQFEGVHCSLEIQLPDLDRTVWFVSGPAEVEQLSAEGIPRGRIWTAVELRALFDAPGMTQKEALAIARTKVAFNGEAIESRAADPPARESVDASIPAEPVQGSLNLHAESTQEHDR